MSSAVAEKLKSWPSISELVYVPQTEDQYQHLIFLLNELIDEVGENESHPLASLMDVIGVLIQKYEDEHIPELS